MKLRPYQAEAVNAVYDHLRTREDNPCVVLPTASGKTPVMSSICRDAVQLWDGRVLVLAHVKELLEQAVDKLHTMAPDLWNQIGVYSAGLRSRDTDHPMIVAGIQSVFRRAKELGPFDLVLIDEAHMIPPPGSKSDGMYRQFLADVRQVNPNVRVIGFTATPFRMKSGPICTDDRENGYLHRICYEVGVKELIAQGYLCPLRAKAGRAKVDTSELHVRAGEFVPSEVEDLMDADLMVRAASAEIVQSMQDRNACLIFAAGVRHAKHVQRLLENDHGVECGCVDGNTPTLFRDEILRRFRDGDLKFLVNVNVLTTGFDAPIIDCVAVLRPTMSPGLLYQMLGRGFRLHPDKQDCLVLEYGGNILRHGPVDQIRVDDPAKRTGGEAPAKECPQCRALIHASYRTCPDCGHEFPKPKPKHEANASTAGVISGQVEDIEYDVRQVSYSVHIKRNASVDTPQTMRVEYQIGFRNYVSEWICFEHTGFARRKAEQWWQARSSEPVPDSAEEAVELADAGVLRETVRVTVRTVAGDKYPRVIAHELTDEPIPTPKPEFAIAEDDIPF